MRQKLGSLQILRALAAIIVVAHHAFRGALILPSFPNDALLIPPAFLVQLGAIGVDLFFILSGFLMMYISEPYFSKRKPVSDFLVHRIIRIWPPYVIVTLVYTLILLKYYKAGPLPYDLQPFRFAGLFFIPTMNEKGLVQPIIGPGWTLSYEMLFYIIFAVVLFTGRRFALIKLTAMLGVIYALGLAFFQTTIGKFMGNSLLVEFLAGAIIGSCVVERGFKPTLPLAWIGAGVGALALSVTLGLSETNLRPIGYGIPALLVFVGFLALNSAHFPKWLMLCGDASYSIYLTHIVVIYKVMYVTNNLLVSHQFGRAAAGTSAIISVFVAVAIGIIFHYIVERPVLKGAQRLYDGFKSRAKGTVSKPVA